MFDHQETPYLGSQEMLKIADKCDFEEWRIAYDTINKTFFIDFSSAWVPNFHPNHLAHVPSDISNSSGTLSCQNMKKCNKNH